MKKTLLAVLLVTAMLVCFVGCSKKSGTAKKGLGTAPVTITVWHCCSEEADTEFQRMVSEFNATNKYQITVKPVYQGQYSDAKTLMLSILQAENYSELPDMMQLDSTGKTAYYNSGKAFTITDAIKYFKDDITSQYLAGPMGNWQFAGVQLGLPFATSTSITFYNADLLKKAGWDHCPDTFADIIKLAADMKKAGLKETCYQDVPNTPSLANWLGQLGSYMMNNANGSDANGTKLDCIDNGALKTFMAAWKSMYDAGALTNKGSSKSDFIAGKVALYTSSTSNITSLKDKINGAFELGASTYPRVNDKASYGATPQGSALAMFDHDSDLRKAAVWELIKFLTNAENQAAFGAATGYTPSNVGSASTAVYQDYLKTHPQQSIVSEQLAKTPATMKGCSPHTIINADFYYGIQGAIISFLTKNLSVDEGVKLVNDTLQPYLDQVALLVE